MKKYVIRYLVLWLPAVLVAYLFNNATPASQIAQWICAALFIAGWGVNTGMAAVHYPRTTLAVLLICTGVNVLLITAKYAAHYGTAQYDFFTQWGGILSFKPLSILVKALIDFDIPQEIYVTGLLIAACLAGYVVGVVYRRIHPNPYRPKIIRS